MFFLFCFVFLRVKVRVTLFLICAQKRKAGIRVACPPIIKIQNRHKNLGKQKKNMHTKSSFVAG